MQNYGTRMAGSIIVERVRTLPMWSSADTGRFLYDLKTENYYLGGPTSSVASKGWIPIGLTSGIIKSNNLDWDTTLSNRFGAISAKDLPILYLNKPSNTQAAINNISDNLESIKSGKYLADGAIKLRHLDIHGTNAITAAGLPLKNAKSLFTPTNGTDVFIEDALDLLYNRRANGVLLDEKPRTGLFTTRLNFSAKTVQDGLECLEDYLAELSADEISCTYQGCNCKTNVQFVIDALYKLYADVAFTDLTDTPAAQEQDKYLKSNGAALIFTDLKAKEVKCQVPGNAHTDVEGLIRCLFDTCDTLTNQINGMNVFASNVKYTSPVTKYSFNNVASALDIIFNNFYSTVNHIPASDISCLAMGGPANTNVQLALSYLNAQVNTLTSTLPCNITASDVSYTIHSKVTNTNFALDYIIGVIDHLISSGQITGCKRIFDV